MLGLGLFATPLFAGAVMQSLNGQSGQNQTFTNDTNVTINSSGNVHALGWAGVLQPSRGGTGVDLSTFNTGSVLFYDGNAISRNDALMWDNTNATLVVDDIRSRADSNLNLFGSTAELEGPGGGVMIWAGNAADTNEPDNYTGGNVVIMGGVGTDFMSGSITLQSLGNFNNNGPVIVNAKTKHYNDVIIGMLDGYMGSPGNLMFTDNNENNLGELAFQFDSGEPVEMSLVTHEPNTNIILFSASRKIGVGEWDPESTLHVNDDTNYEPTLSIGEDGRTSCIALADSDGSGITYVIANNGSLSATSTKPAICH